MMISRQWLDKINGLPQQKFIRVEENFYVGEPTETSEMMAHKKIAVDDNLMETIDKINDLDAGYIWRIRDKIMVFGRSESLSLPRLFNMSEMRQRSLNLLRLQYSDFAVSEKK